MAETRPVEKAGIDRKAVVDAWRILLNAARRDEEPTKTKETKE